LDCQISVFLNLKFKPVFPCSQMHSPPHIYVAKLFNWASYDCHHFANIYKWWFATIATLNLINWPKWFHLQKKKKKNHLCYFMYQMCNHIGYYLDFFFKTWVMTLVLRLWPNKYMTKEMVWESNIRFKQNEIMDFNILEWIFILGVKSVQCPKTFEQGLEDQTLS